MNRNMTNPDLRALLNKPVRLVFKDGEIVEAVLLGVDAERQHDITYEVLRLVKAGAPRALGTAIGATLVASLENLSSWEALSSSQKRRT